MRLGQMAPAEWELTPAYDWQMDILFSAAATPRSSRHLAWANVAVAVDLFSLASPLGWTSEMTHEERFYALQDHFKDQLLDALNVFRAEVDAGNAQAVNNFRKRIQGAMRRHYYDAYALGRQQVDPYWKGFTQADLGRVRGWVDREYGYLRGWTAQLRDIIASGKPLPGGLEYRSSLYGNSLRNAYLTGMADGAHEDDSVTIMAGPVKTVHCAVCPDKWGTYTLEEYNALGGPPPMWCEGLSNCKCIVHVNLAMDPALRQVLDLVKTLGDVEDAELPLPLALWRRERPPTEKEMEAWKSTS